MAQQTINVGAAPNDGTGTPLRTAFQYTNSNFTELYTALGGGSGLPGASTQVIFNDGGTNLAGSAGLVFNKTTSVLGVGTVNAGAAIVSGNLTVDTNTLFVDSANNRVGIGTASPVATLQSAGTFTISGGSAASSANGLHQYFDTGTNTAFISAFHAGVDNRDLVYDAKSHGWRLAAGTAMTLNSTGLGVGVSPSYKLDVTDNSTNIQARLNSSNNNGTSLRFVNTGTSGRTWQIGTGFAVTAGNFEIYDATAAVNRLSIDSSGNVGIGVTPSAKLDVRGPNNGNQAIFTGTASRGLVISTRDDGLANDRTVIFNAAYAAGSLGQFAFQTAGTDRVLMKNNGQLRFVPLASDPAGAEAGDVYYNSTSNKLKCYNGTTWNDLF